MSDPAAYEESPSYKYPGWTRILDGGAVKYRSPDGEVISNYEFSKRRASGAVITSTDGNTALADDVDDDDDDLVGEPITIPPEDKPVKTPLANKLFPKRKKSHNARHPDPSAQASARTRGFKESSEPVSNISSFPRPEPVLKKGFRSNPANHAMSAQQLALGIGTFLVTATSVVERATQTPGITMPLDLAGNLAASIGNLLEPTWINKEFGTYIGGANDYTVIGYSLVMYSMQVSDAIKLKREQVALQREQIRYQSQYGTPQAQHQEVPRQHQAQPQAQPEMPSSNGHQASVQPAFMPPANNLRTPPGIGGL